MKPKKVDLYLIVMLLASSLSLVSLVVNLTNGESFISSLIATVLFGYFAINYWKSGKVGGLKL